ncbi:GNAT family N-acetyltransferase [Haloferax sp. YSMS24]|uniref:GNAT family N-acetyltransferase n=1 Tax=Haloferax sp. YSMS24 TaxID=3388425 RepID=UPI00398CFD92
MPGAVFIEGEKVQLRTVETDDIDFLHRLVNDPEVRRGIAAVDPVTKGNEREWVESRGESDDINFVICYDGNSVGTIGLKPPDLIAGTVEVGYIVSPTNWGEGYATDAVRAICDYAFGERRMNKVYAKAFETNPASSRVLEKAGFTREGVLREEGFVDGEHVDVFRYGLLVDEWRDGTDDADGAEREKKKWFS